MRLNHNMASLNIYNEQMKVLNSQKGALTKITSGVKINTSMDDPNGITRSENLRMQIRGLQVAQRNAQDGSNMVQTAEGALSNATSILQRIKELTVQAGGTNTTADNQIIQKEIEQLKNGFNDIMNDSDFNGIKLLCAATPGSLDMMVGANSGEIAKMPTYNLTASNVGVTGTDSLQTIDVTTPAGLNLAMGIVDKSITQIIDVRSKYGALQSRFDDVNNLTSVISDKLEEVDSGIRDADVAENMMEYARCGILVEAGNALLAQTNKFPQEILKILDNVRR